MYFAGSQLAVFQGANERPYLNHTGRESNAEKRPTGSGPKGCDENGPATALLVGHVSMEICSAPRALSTAHFDRNKIHAISGTGHLPASLTNPRDLRAVQVKFGEEPPLIIL